jgi:alanine dehydrogenase
MALFLEGSDVTALAEPALVMAAAHRAIETHDAETTVVPTRLDVQTEAGFLRVMPAAMGGVMGLKVMTLAVGLGTRYLLLVLKTATGELRGVLDAEHVTRLRTAAITTLAGEAMIVDAPRELALIGTGFEAEGHLRMLAGAWPVERAHVYSRSESRRKEFAARLGAELEIDVRPAASAAEALAAASTVVLATKSEQTVVDCRDVRDGSVVLSIGSTRPDLRELDRGSFARAACVVADDPRQVTAESGDVIEALSTGAIEKSQIASIKSAMSDPSLLERRDGRDLLVFKSVGTAVQDLALADALLSAAHVAGRGRDLGELARLKPFAETATSAATAGMVDGGPL